MIRTPINNGLLQSDLDCDGFDLLNFSGGGGGGGAPARKFDVKTYGAVGDGTTDDTSAIQTALAAIPATGGVLYFPAGQYKYTGGTLTLSKKITVEGDGGVNQFQDTLCVTTIDFNSATATLFDVKVSGCSFKNLGLRNTSSTTPSAGAGILVSGSGGNYDGSRTSYDSITVDGFYVNIDVQAGTAHCWENCLFLEPVLYGLKLRNVLLPDGGDHSISNCMFAGLGGTSSIRIESGGGTKIINTKIVTDGVNGIDLAVGDGITTVDLLVSNCSIESYSGAGIKGTTGTSSKWWNILITGNQFNPVGNGSAIDLSATTAGDFKGVVITGNWALTSGSSSAMIHLANCQNLSLSNNSGYGFADIVTVGSGVTYSDRPQTMPGGGTAGQLLMKLGNLEYDAGWSTPTTLYIGTDARLVSVSGGVKLEARNTGTGTWIEAARWTNP